MKYLLMIIGFVVGVVVAGFIHMSIDKPEPRRVEIWNEDNRMAARLTIEPKISFDLPMTNFTGKVVIK